MKKQESWKNSDLKTESSGKLFFRTKNHWRTLMQNQETLENSDKKWESLKYWDLEP